MGDFKMCDILETTGRRVKRTKIWTSEPGKYLVYKGYF